jgi:hypothetical protein
MQADARVPVPDGNADLSLGQRGGGPEIGSPLRLGDPAQALSDPLSLAKVSLLDVDVDQEREHRADHGGLADCGELVVRACSGPLEQVPRERRIAVGQMERGEGGDDVGMLLQALEKLGGLLRRPCRPRRSARRMIAAARRPDIPRSK